MKRNGWPSRAVSQDSLVLPLPFRTENVIHANF